MNLRIEGIIVGFDEYMNVVMDDAEEFHMKTKNRKSLGRSELYYPVKIHRIKISSS